MAGYTLREAGGKLCIDGEPPCAPCQHLRPFRDIVIVHEPLSPNPGIEIPVPFGMNGLKNVLFLIEQWRLEQAEALGR